MSNIVQEKYDEVVQMITDHINNEDDLKCWEFVQELIEEFYEVTETQESCQRLLELVLKAKK